MPRNSMNIKVENLSSASKEILKELQLSVENYILKFQIKLTKHLNIPHRYHLRLIRCTMTSNLVLVKY
jgi:hypothetical protein